MSTIVWSEIEMNPKNSACTYGFPSLSTTDLIPRDSPMPEMYAASSAKTESLPQNLATQIY